MPYISVEESELISFFGVEAIKIQANEPWMYCDNVFFVQQDDVMLSFTILPFYRDVCIKLRVKDKQVYEFLALGVKDVSYRQDETGGVLILQITEKEAMLLRVNPEILIVHETQFEP